MKKLTSYTLLLFAAINFSAWAKNVSYKGPIYNIFFHPLIVYPELAFDPKSDRLGYMDEWFVTRSEYIKTMEELYKRGFVLFAPKDLFGESTDQQGNVVIVQKEIILPEGKKPLILSLDDYNFYEAMRTHGTIHRFWVDASNQLATMTDQKNDRPLIKYDQEIPQLLENFVAKHPDFSFNGARGIIALTGYHGILGYHTEDLKNEDYLNQVREAKKVANKIKQLGWEFASHSYFHLGESDQREQAFEVSEQRWQKEVASIVGKTPHYIFPFGDPWNKDKVRMNFLKSLGYKYFFGVSNTSWTEIRPGAVIMGRFPMDGRSLRGNYAGLAPFAVAKDIIDPARPKTIKY